MAVKTIKIAIHADTKKEYERLHEIYRLSKFPNNWVVDWERSRGRDPKEFVHLYGPKNETSAEMIAVTLARLYAVLKEGDYLVDGFQYTLASRLEEHFEKTT